MDGPLTLFPPGPHELARLSPEAAPPREAHLRGLRRRLWTLLVAGGLAFVLTTWALVRLDHALGPRRLGASPASVVRAHLDALNRGELRAAYDLFSPRYREKVPFEAFHQLVVTHGRLFHTRLLRLGKDEESGERAVLETYLLAESGEPYLARYTLVRAQGRWWIDDLHWTADPGSRKLLTAQSTAALPLRPLRLCGAQIDNPGAGGIDSPATISRLGRDNPLRGPPGPLSR